MYKDLLGLSGGSDATYWQVVIVSDPFSSFYYPAMSADGQEMMWSDFDNFDDYMAAKQKRRRVTVRLTVAGNPVAAEAEIMRRTGKRCLATTPNTLDIYVVEDDPDAE